MVIVFTLTVFLSACLLFAIQPMVAKSLLPVFGGGSSVWTTCMLFYQTLLLIGYLYAHILMTRFGRRSQILIHSVVLLTALLAGIFYDTPVAPPTASTFPVPWLILQLTLISGLPFFAISSAGPLIQGWFSRTDHKRAHDPYFLYAASNLGSMIGLIAYPLVLEPKFGLSSQRGFWLIGFGMFMFMAIYAVMQTKSEKKLTKKQAKRQRKAEQRKATGNAAGSKQVDQLDSESRADEPTTWQRRLYWIYLAFIPSSLLLGVTNYITTDVVSLPLLWVLPLMIYLGTMIVAFGTHSRRAVQDFTRPMVFAVLAAMVLFLANEIHILGSMIVTVLIALMLLTTVGIVCHGRLAMDRPHAGKLTEFYLLMSVGGALGGIFNGIVSPLVFTSHLEYPIALVLSLSILPWSRDLADLSAAKALRIKLIRRVGMPLLAVLFVLVFGYFGADISEWVGRVSGDGEHYGIAPQTVMMAMTILIPGIFVFLTWKDGFACALTYSIPIAAIQINAMLDDEVIFVERTFYGVHKVNTQVLYDSVKEEFVPVHIIHHGTTIHGIQFMDPELEIKPLGYYHYNGPCGMIMNTMKEMRPDGARFGIMGLGSGAIAAHGREQDSITFFEIDPVVEQIARDPKLFTYLDKVPADVEVRLGDARKLIEESQDANEEKYDLLHADAFSSDSIPVHLVTEEAINLYFDRLTDDGMVVLHISNRYLDLMPLVYELALKTTRLAPLVADDTDRSVIPEEEVIYRLSSRWVVLTRSQETGQRLIDAGMSSYTVEEENRIRVWTDDYSNIISLINWK